LDDGDAFAGSIGGIGLVSVAEALRFLPVAGVRVEEAGGGAWVDEAVDSDELAACLAAARVILLLGGMSIRF